jgi:hypothetical protein
MKTEERRGEIRREKRRNQKREEEKSEENRRNRWESMIETYTRFARWLECNCVTIRRQNRQAGWAQHLYHTKECCFEHQ